MNSTNIYSLIGRLPILSAFLWNAHAFAADPGYTLTSTTPLSVSAMVGGVPTVSEWSHGAFIILEVGNPLVKSFTVLDRDGSILSRSEFSIPDSTRMWVNGYDRDVTGNLVFCGQAYSSDGRLAPFIAIKSTRSGDTQLIRTFPYWPMLLSVAPDGTIWTIGSERAADGKLSGPGVNPNGNVVRHFDRAGKLIGSAFQRREVFPLSRKSYGYLTATSDRIGWYAPIDGPATYVELSPSLDTYKVYNGPPDQDGQALGFTLTESGKAFVTNMTQKKRATYTLDRTSSKWNEVSLPELDGPVLHGSEKETLVLTNATGLLFLDANRWRKPLLLIALKHTPKSNCGPGVAGFPANWRPRI